MIADFTNTFSQAPATDPREGDPAYEQAQRLMKAIDAILQDTARNRGEARTRILDAIDTALSIVVADRKDIPLPSPAAGREMVALSGYRASAL